MPFELKADYKPAWDQPKAINQIVEAFENWKKNITLLWATGTWKTFTMANIIQKVQRPTLVISHNKTLAAQLSTEFKAFFPNNAVHYFVSYFDYYQPESYLPSSWTYIEKEATINDEIEMYRLATMASLLSRDDVIVVASASSLYGLWQSRFFQENMLQLKVGQSYDFKEIKHQLLHMQYKPVHGKIEAWMFELQWERLDVYSSTEKSVYRCFFDEDVIERIEIRDSVTFELKSQANQIILWPATQYLQDTNDLETILQQIDLEKELRIKEFEKAWMLVEAERIKKRVEYDLRMIRETWFVNGIENYSLYFDKRLPGEAPNTIFDYFPKDFLLIIDESHMTIPQLNAMSQWDRARKNNLIKYWFRLPSAIDHRPLRFEELEATLWRKSLDEIKLDQATDNLDLVSTTHLKVLESQVSGNVISNECEKSTTKKKNSPMDFSAKPRNDNENTKDFHPAELDKLSTEWQSLINKEARAENQRANLQSKIKTWAKSIFLSATPAEYELNLSDEVVEQIIRPTWLLDPITYVYPKSWDYAHLLASVDKLLKKKPYLETYLSDKEPKKDEKDILKDLFEEDSE